MKITVAGSGIAGLSAAIEAAERGAEVTLLSPAISERAQSVMAAGGINAAIDTYNEGDSIDSHVSDTLKAGCFLENENDIREFCERAPENLRWLIDMGTVFNREKDGKLSQRSFGGQSHKRTAFAGTSIGRQIITAMTQKCREFEIKGKITRMTGPHFHSALIKDGKCYGITALTPSGEVLTLPSDAVIIATGGMNRLFGKTTGSELCDGYTAGKLLSQGVTMRNLEFIQFHPTTIETAHKHILISEAARAEGGRLYYIRNNGERCFFMEEKYGEKGNLMSRDIVSKCMNDCPSQVYLDISFLGEDFIKKRLYEIYDICRTYISLDAAEESIPVVPSIHYFMGGIAVDRNHETNIENLYAAGECASKYHGANRLGGNSLMSAVYSGRKAAETAAGRPPLKETAAEMIFKDETAEAEREVLSIFSSEKTCNTNRILKKISEIMNCSLGIVRTQEDIAQGIREIETLMEGLKESMYDPDVTVYENCRPKYMALLADAVLRCAEERKESRGAHNRADYPETEDAYRKCTVCSFSDGEMHISYRDEVNNENKG